MASPTYISWRDLLDPGLADDYFVRRQTGVFDPAASGYDKSNAIFLAELSRLVYHRDPGEENPHPGPPRSHHLAKVDLEELAFIESTETDTQAFIVASTVQSQFAVLVFRGTEKKVDDWANNLSPGTDSWSGEKAAAHDGFEEALESVWAKIEQKLASITSPVFYTGHSLGAALATLSAARRKPDALYTYASPRVGNRLFVDSLSGIPVYRHVHGVDLVPTVPPEWLGYEHLGPEIYLKPVRPRLSLNPFEWFRRLRAPAAVLADHAPVNYVDRV